MAQCGPSALITAEERASPGAEKPIPKLGLKLATKWPPTKLLCCVFTMARVGGPLSVVRLCTSMLCAKIEYHVWYQYSKWVVAYQFVSSLRIGTSPFHHGSLPRHPPVKRPKWEMSPQAVGSLSQRSFLKSWVSGDIQRFV